MRVLSEVLMVRSESITREWHVDMSSTCDLKRPSPTANDLVISQELLSELGGKQGWVAVATLFMRECRI